MCRSFGRFTLVGTHVINTIHKFLYQPVTKRDKEAAAAAAAKKARKKGNFVESRKEVKGRLDDDGDPPFVYPSYFHFPSEIRGLGIITGPLLNCQICSMLD